MNNRSLRMGATLCAVALAGGGLVACSGGDSTYHIDSAYCNEGTKGASGLLQNVRDTEEEAVENSESWGSYTSHIPPSVGVSSCLNLPRSEDSDQKLSGTKIDELNLAHAMPSLGQADEDGDREISKEELTKALGDPTDFVSMVLAYTIAKEDHHYKSVDFSLPAGEPSLYIEDKYLNNSGQTNNSSPASPSSPSTSPTRPKSTPTPAPAPAPASTETRALAFDGDGNYAWATGATSDEALDGALSRMDDPDDAGYATSTDCIALMYDPVDGSYFTGTGKSILAAQLGSDHHTVGAEPVATYCAGDSEPQVAS